MSNYLDLFAEHLRGADRSEHTVEAYTGDVAAFFVWLAERLGRNPEPVEVTFFDLQKYRQALLDQGRKPAGINRRPGGRHARVQGQLARCHPTGPGRRGVQLRHLLGGRVDHGTERRLPAGADLRQRRAQGRRPYPSQHRDRLSAYHRQPGGGGRHRTRG